jgi:transposase
MTTLTNYKRILVAEYFVNFRKSHDGLLAEARKNGLDPFLGDVLVFLSRCRRKIKVLYSDKTGLWLSYKRFSAGTIKTKLKFLVEYSVKEITTAELSMLLEGNEYSLTKKAKEWEVS